VYTNSTTLAIHYVLKQETKTVSSCGNLLDETLQEDFTEATSK
jgi:hypothetical protein